MDSQDSYSPAVRLMDILKTARLTNNFVLQMQRTTFDEADSIIERGEAARDLYIVDEGTCIILREDDINLAALKDPEKRQRIFDTFRSATTMKSSVPEDLRGLEKLTPGK